MVIEEHEEEAKGEQERAMTDVSVHDSKEERKGDDVERSRIDLFVVGNRECVDNLLEGLEEGVGSEVSRGRVLVSWHICQMQFLEHLVLLLQTRIDLPHPVHAPGKPIDDLVVLVGELVEGLVNVDVMSHNHPVESHLSVLGIVAVPSLNVLL